MEVQRSGVYKITNILNGKFYIGQSSHLEQRWEEHRQRYKDLKVNKDLYKAMREDGIENFIFEILEECPVEQLFEREKYWITKLDAINLGYNMNLFNNALHKVSSETSYAILNDLMCSNLTNSEIAEKYNVSRTLISLANKGEIYHRDDIKYPIRKVQNDPKKIYYCEVCGKEINRGCKKCYKCQKEEQFKNSRRSLITREELKDYIRNKTFMEIGRMFGVRDNTIRKWCKAYKLPFRKKDINAYSDEEWALI